MKCIFCKAKTNVKPMDTSAATTAIDGICDNCLKGLKRNLEKIGRDD